MIEQIALWGDEFTIDNSELTAKILKKIKKPKALKEVSLEKLAKAKNVSVKDKIERIRPEVERILGGYKDNTVCIYTRDDFHNYISAAIENKIIAIDTETLGTRTDIDKPATDPFTCRLAGLCLYTPGQKNAYIPVNHVDYETGEVNITLDAAASGADVSIKYRYDWGATPDGTGQKPAQIVLEWKSKTITANPYRLRSTYSLDDFYAAKQVLNGYDIDQVLSTSLGGLINKEISCNMFDEMLARADGTKAWNSILPSGVSQIEHNMSILQAITEASNEIRKNIARSGANWIVAGSKLMNILEALSANFYNSKDIWSANSYSAEPIGPYVAGTLFNRYKVLKNQDFDEDTALMGYKRDDMDASYLTGSFISLYATNPLAMDDLHSIQGMGCQLGGTRACENSMMKFVIE
jgi:hypothetical protein